MAIPSSALRFIFSHPAHTSSPLFFMDIRLAVGPTMYYELLVGCATALSGEPTFSLIIAAHNI
jgi:hypothetical protein